MVKTFKIDLISDTSSKPTAGMRQAIANADVGDEQRGEDPSVIALCERSADLLGKEAALFLPSGTMCNQIALAVHCRPGDEIIASDTAHILTLEGAGAAVFAGSFINGIACDNGIFNRDQLMAALRKPSIKSPKARVVAIEQTTNRGGGAIWPLENIRDIAEIAHANEMVVHMDGARLLNAVVASGISAQDFCKPCDTTWLDLSKGLGCPVGGVLAGSKDFIDEALVWKFRLGGAMRQAGIVAAAGLYALDHHVERLAEDHDNAKLLADTLNGLEGFELTQPRVETNLIFFSVEKTGKTARDISEHLLEYGIRIGVEDQYGMRAVTHLDVSCDDIAFVCKTLKSLFG